MDSQSGRQDNGKNSTKQQKEKKNLKNKNKLKLDGTMSSILTFIL